MQCDAQTWDRIPDTCSKGAFICPVHNATVFTFVKGGSSAAIDIDPFLMQYQRATTHQHLLSNCASTLAIKLRFLFVESPWVMNVGA